MYTYKKQKHLAPGNYAKLDFWVDQEFYFYKTAQFFCLSFPHNRKIQEVPAFRNFWFQRVIMKCGDHEFRGLF